MFQASVPICYWGECVLTAAYLINRTPSNLLQGKTPYFMLFQQEPDFSHIKTFGCLCYVSVIPRSTDKFAARGKRCVFMGYPSGKKGWRVLDIETGKLFVSRDVVFQEDQFPLAVTTSLLDSSKESDVVHPAVFDTDPSCAPTSSLLPTSVKEGSQPIALDLPAPLGLPAADPVVRRSSRERVSNVRLRDFVCNTVLHQDPRSYFHFPFQSLSQVLLTL